MVIVRGLGCRVSGIVSRIQGCFMSVFWQEAFETWARKNSFLFLELLRASHATTSVDFSDLRVVRICKACVGLYESALNPTTYTPFWRPLLRARASPRPSSPWPWVFGFWFRVWGLAILLQLWGLVWGLFWGFGFGVGWGWRFGFGVHRVCDHRAE